MRENYLQVGKGDGRGVQRRLRFFQRVVRIGLTEVRFLIHKF